MVFLVEEAILFIAFSFPSTLNLLGVAVHETYRFKSQLEWNGDENYN